MTVTIAMLLKEAFNYHVLLCGKNALKLLLTYVLL
jgi:hypothetical protein